MKPSPAAWRSLCGIIPASARIRSNLPERSVI
jgi:hypothetical protein